MKVRIEVKYAEDFADELDWGSKRRVQNAVESKKEDDLNAIETLDLTMFKKEQLVKIKKSFEKNKEKSKNVLYAYNTLLRYEEILKNPENVNISSLEGLKTSLEEFFRKTGRKQMFILQEDNKMILYNVHELVLKHSREDGSFVRLELKRNRSPFEKNDYNPDVSESYYFHKWNLSDDVDDFMSDSDIVEDYDDEDDDGEIKKKRKPKSKKPKNLRSLEQILESKNLLLAHPGYVEDYKTQVKRFYDFLINNNNGAVYICNEKCKFIEEKDEERYYSYWRSNNWRYLKNGEVNNKLAVDYGQKDVFSLFDMSVKSLPDIPYIKVFDLEFQQTYMVHVDNLIKYKFNKNLSEKLIIDDDNKDLIELLIHDDDVLNEDIIQGKSGGITILCYGKPGLGKTLTSEIFSESLEKPLYKIQASQLGIKIEDIEKRLQRILKRSERIGAILLIDECDTYLRKRGDDIVQNCVVGIFLKLMEYYNGILFLTTNLYDDIDDAILSRVTAKFRYEYPNKDQAYKIWLILCEQFELSVDVNEIRDIVDYSYKEDGNQLSGRSIKNIVKLGKKYCNKKNVSFSLEIFKIVQKYITR